MKPATTTHPSPLPLSLHRESAAFFFPSLSSPPSSWPQQFLPLLLVGQSGHLPFHAASSFSSPLMHFYATSSLNHHPRFLPHKVSPFSVFIPFPSPSPFHTDVLSLSLFVYIRIPSNMLHTAAQPHQSSSFVSFPLLEK
ncbi:hypothetical protein RIF29_30406 [Crotalaria pallida]|uniref:Uncharacterized protein n=1 Tax=Crotalaria pallida TaxID=3830 RepID=A0AAN9EN08_CROPI